MSKYNATEEPFWLPRGGGALNMGICIPAYRTTLAPPALLNRSLEAKMSPSDQKESDIPECPLGSPNISFSFISDPTSEVDDALTVLM